MKIQFRKSHGVVHCSYIWKDRQGNRKVTLYVDVMDKKLFGNYRHYTKRTCMILSYEDYLQFKSSLCAAEEKHFTGNYRKAQSYFEKDRWARKKRSRLD